MEFASFHSTKEGFKAAFGGDRCVVFLRVSIPLRKVSRVLDMALSIACPQMFPFH